MDFAAFGEDDWDEGGLATATLPAADARSRIMDALGATDGGVPAVSEETLARYYEYLSANLSFPFDAYYPEPTNSGQETEYRCTVLELLDPSKYLGDEYEGIFCRTVKGRYEINLPLDELLVPPESPQSQLIEDYWYWFWNFRWSWLAPLAKQRPKCNSAKAPVCP